MQWGYFWQNLHFVYSVCVFICHKKQKTLYLKFYMYLCLHPFSVNNPNMLTITMTQRIHNRIYLCRWYEFINTTMQTQFWDFDVKSLCLSIVCSDTECCRDLLIFVRPSFFYPTLNTNNTFSPWKFMCLLFRLFTVGQIKQLTQGMDK